MILERFIQATQKARKCQRHFLALWLRHIFPLRHSPEQPQVAACTMAGGTAWLVLKKVQKNF